MWSYPYEMATASPPHSCPSFTSFFLKAFPRSVTESSCCVYYMAPLGVWWLHRKPELRSPSTGPRSPGLLGRSEPSWLPGWMTGPGPKVPLGTTLQPEPGMNQILRRGNPREKQMLLDGWQSLGWQQSDWRAKTPPYTAGCHLEHNPGIASGKIEMWQ